MTLRKISLRGIVKERHSDVRKNEFTGVSEGKKE